MELKGWHPAERRVIICRNHTFVPLKGSTFRRRHFDYTELKPHRRTKAPQWEDSSHRREKTPLFSFRNAGKHILPTQVLKASVKSPHWLHWNSFSLVGLHPVTLWRKSNPGQIISECVATGTRNAAMMLQLGHEMMQVRVFLQFGIEVTSPEVLKHPHRNQENKRKPNKKPD